MGVAISRNSGSDHAVTAEPKWATSTPTTYYCYSTTRVQHAPLLTTILVSSLAKCFMAVSLISADTTMPGIRPATLTPMVCIRVGSQCGTIGRRATLHAKKYQRMGRIVSSGAQKGERSICAII